eukprot:5933540-Prorocentrum_lima.AAC.1
MLFIDPGCEVRDADVDRGFGMLVNCLKPGTVHSFADIAAAMNCDISESVAAGMALHPLLWFINSAQA